MAKSWLLTKPVSNDAALVERLRTGLERDQQYRVTDAGADWEVSRIGEPPVLITELAFRMTSHGPINGTPVDIERRLRKWWRPGVSIGGMPPNHLDGYLRQLDLARDPKRNPIEWAKRNELAGLAFGSALPDRLGEVIARVDAAYRKWSSEGQLIVWERNPAYMPSVRIEHVVASGLMLGVDAMREAADANTSWWIHGEDLLSSPIASVFLDLIPLGTSGIAWDTVPYTFIWDFGEYRGVRPEPLDALSLWRLHSVGVAHYAATAPPHRWRVPTPDWLNRDALRSWFIAGINRLAAYMVSLENFRTDSGRLRPEAQQQVYLTVARTVTSTAVLFASSEPLLQRMAFWDLVDLYAGLRREPVTTSVAQVLSKGFWDAHVVPAAGTLPGSLGQRWRALAQSRYRRWVRETVRGVTVPSRKRRSWVVVGAENSAIHVRWHEFFAAHLEARRHTLHGYYPQNAERFRDYMAIHDGRLPHGLPEWGRFMLIGLINDPYSFMEAFTRIPLA